MTEPLRTVRFADPGQPLREDVSLLGGLLGEVLVEQGGGELLERVESARSAAIRRRQGEPGAGEELAAQLQGLDAVVATELVRAFSAFFALVNMAEAVHRIRRRRESLRDPAQPQRGSLAAVVRDLADRGLTRDEVLATLSRLQVTPVLTAHPTAATRRTLLAKEQRIARALVDRLEQPAMTPPEEEASRARLRTEIGLIWQTDEHPEAERTVADEVEFVAFYLTDVVYRVIPGFYAALGRALEEVFGPGADGGLPCPVVRFGSWVGGDMDGNPNVGPDTILATLNRQRQLIVDRYRREVRRLFDHLSQGLARVGVAPEVEARIAEYRELMPEAADRVPSRYHDMPYRVLLWLVWERLGATAQELPGGYPGPAAFADDLGLVVMSLERHRGHGAGLGLVRRLLQRVKTLGFHLATLDVRQDALVHRRDVGAVLGVEGFDDLAPEERGRRLREALAASPATVAEAGEGEPGTLAVLRAIGEARRRFGVEAVGPYIISMAQGPDDVLALLLLGRRAGLVGPHGGVDLDVAPLFETVDDLDHARPTFEAMLDDPAYRSHLASRGDEQVVMLGYSDSSKISGLAASRWALFRAQEGLVACADGAGIRLTLFHGRGGTVSRGGSKPRAAILAEPVGAIRGRLRVTEQGEIVHAKYGLRGLAERTLELVAGAVLEATALEDPARAPHPEWRVAMGAVAATGRAAYDDLVHRDPDFIPYFRLATPVDVVERLRIGSRPPSRRSGTSVEDLRAIPWVFAWVQSRHLLPGWYGVGSGLEAAAEAHGEGPLADMAKGWPFFANLLADVEMVCAKADMAIAARYAALAGEVGERVFPRLREEYGRTVAWVTRLQGISEPLEREPVLRQSIELRNPYVDPMSLVQVDLLRRWRETGRGDPELERALFTTVRGIARGMLNTG